MLSRLEVAADLVLPERGRLPRLSQLPAGTIPRAALASAILPAPVPITHRFPAAAETDESDRQEQVVAHLVLEDWVRIELMAELEPSGRWRPP